jgi:hypothetical protein
MALKSPGGSTRGAAEGGKLRLSGGAIASIIGVGLLVIFMIQNPNASRSASCSELHLAALAFLPSSWL